MLHNLLNSWTDAALEALNSYPRICGLIGGLLTGRMLHTLAGLFR